MRLLRAAVGKSERRVMLADLTRGDGLAGMDAGDSSLGFQDRGCGLSLF